jgi:hypothetical protein
MSLVREQGREPHHGEAHAPDHLEMTRQMWEKWLWTNATVALLGVWLISSPFTFGYTRPALIWSDVASGVLLAIFSVVAFWPRWSTAAPRFHPNSHCSWGSRRRSATTSCSTRSRA